MSIYKYIDQAGRDDLLDMRDAINKALKKFPKEEKRLKPKNPEDEFRISCHRLAKDWLNNNGFEDFQWNGAQNKGLNGLMDNIKCSLKRFELLTPEIVVEWFAKFMLSLPKFYANKVNFLTLHHNYNNICQEIRSAKDGRQQLGSQSNSGVDIVSAALQRLNGGVPGR